MDFPPSSKFHNVSPIRWSGTIPSAVMTAGTTARRAACFFYCGSFIMAVLSWQFYYGRIVVTAKSGPPQELLELPLAAHNITDKFQDHCRITKEHRLICRINRRERLKESHLCHLPPRMSGHWASFVLNSFALKSQLYRNSGNPACQTKQKF